MDRIELSERDLIEAVLAAQPQDTPTGGALTMRELIGQTGLSDKRLRDRLHQLQDEGRLDVRVLLKRSLDGKLVRVPGYRLKVSE